MHFIALAVFLGVVSALAPEPWQTDREGYERLGRIYFHPGCESIHCFRVLVPWLLEALPGLSFPKWKAYSVICQAGAALGVARLCLTWGLTPRTALMASGLAAFGFGSLYTLYDPYTSDPLIHLLSPMVILLFSSGRATVAGGLGAVGVFAKEFAVIPFWILTGFSVLRRRWTELKETVGIAVGVTCVWLAWQTFLRVALAYRTVEASGHLLSGAYLRVWVTALGIKLAAISVFTVFGGLYLLAPFGALRADDRLKGLLVAALPWVALMVYVQQADRALWNFFFLVVPAAVVILERVPGWLSWLFVASYGIANLRLGAQLDIVPRARYALLVSCVLALAMLLVVLRRQRRTSPARPAGASQRG